MISTTNDKMLYFISIPPPNLKFPSVRMFFPQNILRGATILANIRAQSVINGTGGIPNIT